LFVAKHLIVDFSQIPINIIGITCYHSENAIGKGWGTYGGGNDIQSIGGVARWGSRKSKIERFRNHDRRG